MNRTVWEYLDETRPDRERLNELGAEGWELVGVSDGIFYLKRPGPTFRERVTIEQRRAYTGRRGGKES